MRYIIFYETRGVDKLSGVLLVVFGKIGSGARTRGRFGRALVERPVFSTPMVNLSQPYPRTITKNLSKTFHRIKTDQTIDSWKYGITR